MDSALLVEALMRNNVLSVSPGVGTYLLTVKGQVRKAARAESNPDVASALHAYAAALGTVCDVAVLHQGAVIATLAALVGEKTQVAG